MKNSAAIQVLTVGASLLATQVQQGATGTTQTAPYRGITTTLPREFGVSVRIALGSR